MRSGRVVALALGSALVAVAPLASAGPDARPRECFLLQKLEGSQPYVSDRDECDVAGAPASTFKLPHALIALEAGVVEDPLRPVSWNGARQPFERWEREHSLDSAIKWSVVWFFRRTAALLGPERMREGLRQLAYASDTFEGDVSEFWLNGDLRVSPREQLSFLSRMMRHALPVSRPHVDAVRQALVMPEGRITNAAGVHDFDFGWPGPVVLRAKTGYTSAAGEQVSWLVGHVEARAGEYVFVSRVRGPSIPGTAGAELARRMLKSRAPQAAR
jgi:beta-lactamase class D